MPLDSTRTVNINEIDDRSQKFEITFLQNKEVKVEAILTMGPVLHNLMQHWLLHNDDLFVDVLHRAKP